MLQMERELSGIQNLRVLRVARAAYQISYAIAVRLFARLREQKLRKFTALIRARTGGGVPDHPQA